ncbi:BTB domain transcription factor [Balamuthia mandrillaris]
MRRSSRIAHKEEEQQKKRQEAEEAELERAKRLSQEEGQEKGAGAPAKKRGRGKKQDEAKARGGRKEEAEEAGEEREKEETEEEEEGGAKKKGTASAKRAKTGTEAGAGGDARGRKRKGGATAAEKTEGAAEEAPAKKKAPTPTSVAGKERGGRGRGRAAGARGAGRGKGRGGAPAAAAQQEAEGGKPQQTEGEQRGKDEGEGTAQQGTGEPKEKEKEKEVTSSTAAPSKEEAGQGREKKWTLEKGHIFFFYRPKVEHTSGEVSGLKDVARLHMVLKPEWRQDKGPLKSRIIVVARKKMPDIKTHQRFWAYVETAKEDVSEASKLLAGYSYNTQTLGERTQEEERAAAEGRYSIVMYHDNTHLAFVLEKPEELGPVQKEFNIPKEGSYVISVKNPETPSPPYAGLPAYRKATFDAFLRDRFQGRKWVPADPIDYLNYENAELILVGAATDVRKELSEIGEKLEEEVDEELRGMEPMDASDVFEELKMKKHEAPTTAVTTGEWA